MQCIIPFGVFHVYVDDVLPWSQKLPYQLKLVVLDPNVQWKPVLLRAFVQVQDRVLKQLVYDLVLFVLESEDQRSSSIQIYLINIYAWTLTE